MCQQDKSIILVTVKVLVYNQAPYLRQCLDGIISQKINFRFEVIVHDDCSSDGSTDIIREYAEKYPDIIKPIYETENQYCKDGFSGIDKIMDVYIKGKYIAYCEGDDYWTDTQKLQKQVDFLESHDDYGLVYTQFQVYNQQKNSFAPGWCRETTLEKEFGGNDIMTLTVCLRTSLYLKYQDQIRPQKEWKMGDMPLWIYLLSQSRAHFIPDITCVYRQNQGTASHPASLDGLFEFRENAYSVLLYLASRLNIEYLMPRVTIEYLLSMYIIIIANDGFKNIDDKHLIRKYGIFNPKILILYIVVRISYLRRIIRSIYNFQPLS